jgi:hypothetical protein
MANTLHGIRPGDRVRLLVPNGIGRAGVEYKEVRGVAMIVGPDRVAVNLGGKFGRPGVVTAENYVAHTHTAHALKGG